MSGHRISVVTRKVRFSNRDAVKRSYFSHCVLKFDPELCNERSKLSYIISRVRILEKFIVPKVNEIRNFKNEVSRINQEEEDNERMRNYKIIIVIK